MGEVSAEPTKGDEINSSRNDDFSIPVDKDGIGLKDFIEQLEYLISWYFESNFKGFKLYSRA